LKKMKFYTIWKVINFEGKILFEGRYDECYRYLNENNITDVTLEPFMHEHRDLQ